ncbi:MAG TPA: zinc-dependent metalloprotease [Polyangiaceae bacterium]|nr:zinc-dependent metalloprotease [Polyangiaceae bacterium]
MEQHKTKQCGSSSRRWGLRIGAFAATAFLGACAADNAEEPVPDDTLLTHDPFVAIAREGTEARARAVEQVQQALRAAPPPMGQPPARSGEFYLAISKAELGSKWFMSGYLGQYHPGGVAAGAAASLGTRVVSFRIQNGKVFVFDVDDRKKVSGTFDPQVVVDAYPIVTDYEPFNRLPNANQYVLVDPSAGLNDFDVISDFYARGETAARFKVELSFLQRFRRIADGATFEEVFTGYSDAPDPTRQGTSDPLPIDTNAFRASGTLGIALRRYQEGQGFTQMPVVQSATGFDLFFRSDPRLVPNQGFVDQSSIKWNIRSGMTPIKWVISDQVIGVQQRYPQYDIIGALKAGIENWNEVFGFKVFEASVASTDQSFADDDVNYFIYDEDPSNGFAFADWRSNPNTGEVRGASVYYNSIWLTDADTLFEDDPAPANLAQRVRRPTPTVRWKPMIAKHLCTLEAPSFRANYAPQTLPAGLTKKQKVEQFLTHIGLHEIGHILGLRHNFKGSLVSGTAASTTCMDYLDDPSSIARSHPGSYDHAALKYLYGLSTSLPEDPFCTDEELELDTNCNTFDITADPMEGYYAPRYAAAFDAELAGKPLSQGAEDSRINGILQFVRSGDTSVVKAAALAHALAPVKVDPTRTPAPDPAAAALIDGWERRVLSRLVLDDAGDRGYFVDDPDVSDAALGPALTAEVKAVLLNGDGLRSYPSRRTMVDILKKVQSAAAYRALREGKTALEASRPTTPPDQVLDLDDLMARIDRAITPYYD